MENSEPSKIAPKMFWMGNAKDKKRIDIVETELKKKNMKDGMVQNPYGCSDLARELLLKRSYSC